jgi:hypothetical protein
MSFKIISHATKPYWGQVWWLKPVISALRRLRQEDHKFEVSLGYTARP